MTKEQAINAINEGKKVTHRFFDDNEWVSSENGGKTYIFEDGTKNVNPSMFWTYRTGENWKTDWSIKE